MLTINVYIVGDSVSGRRQGLFKITKKTGIEFGATAMDGLSRHGYFQLADDGAWVFTKGAWQRAESDNLRFADQQYVTNIEEMI
jgi:hypothetical protein